MARYKPAERNGLFIPVVLEEQIQPGTFEFALQHMVDVELDLSALDAKFRNDTTGASAYDPRHAQDRAAGLQPRAHHQPQDRAGLRTERAVHGPQRRHAHGRQLYSRRIATVEPVFANIRHYKGMSRFTLRGKAKVATTVAALLPGAQHREDRDKGDARALKGCGPALRTGAQASAH